MIAVIVSAGAGTRLLPLTRKLPKCLVRVDGRTILDWQLDAINSARFEGVVVIVGYRFSQIAARLERHPPPLPVKLLFNPFWAKASSIGSVWAAREHLHDPFCLMNGDSIYDQQLLAKAVARAATGVNLLVEPLTELHQDDMLVAAESGRVRAVSKGLPPKAATHRSLGVIISTADGRPYVEALDSVIASPGGTDAFHHQIVNHLAKTVPVEAVVAEGPWQEIDRPEDIALWSSRFGNIGGTDVDPAAADYSDAFLQPEFNRNRGNS